jgi:hydrogenase-4 component F
VTGLFAVTAIPPFGPFFSELGILRAGMETGHGSAVAVFMICMLFAFIGLARLVFAIVDGRPRAAAKRLISRESAGVILPPLVFLAFSLWLGLATPAILHQTWEAAASFLHATP